MLFAPRIRESASDNNLDHHLHLEPDAKSLLRIASRFSYLGIFFGVAIVIGFFSGRWLDGHFHTEPRLSIVGLLVGIAAGFSELLRLAKRGLRDMQALDNVAAGGNPDAPNGVPGPRPSAADAPPGSPPAAIDP